jgi:hypothetical protein
MQLPFDTSKYEDHLPIIYSQSNTTKHWYFMAGLKGKPAEEWLEVTMLKVKAHFNEMLSDHQHDPIAETGRSMKLCSEIPWKVMKIT